MMQWWVESPSGTSKPYLADSILILLGMIFPSKLVCCIGDNWRRVWEIVQKEDYNLDHVYTFAVETLFEDNLNEEPQNADLCTRGEDIFKDIVDRYSVEFMERRQVVKRKLFDPEDEADGIPIAKQGYQASSTSEEPTAAPSTHDEQITLSEYKKAILQLEAEWPKCKRCQKIYNASDYHVCKISAYHCASCDSKHMFCACESQKHWKPLFD